MKTLKEFRPTHKNVVQPKTKASRSRARKKKSPRGEYFSVTNLALAACALLLGYGQYKKMGTIDELKQSNAQLSQRIEQLEMEKMKYMADKKIQEIEKETLNHKVAHIGSLKAVIAKSKGDLEKVTSELQDLKKVKMTALQYKRKLAEIENSYQERLDAHNRESTDTIARMGRKMMAEVDKKTRAPASVNRHVVQFKGSSAVGSKVMPTNSNEKVKRNIDEKIDDWRESNMEF